MGVVVLECGRTIWEGKGMRVTDSASCRFGRTKVGILSHLPSTISAHVLPASQLHNS
jgi:hypothetical protein